MNEQIRLGSLERPSGTSTSRVGLPQNATSSTGVQDLKSLEGTRLRHIRDNAESEKREREKNGDRQGVTRKIQEEFFASPRPFLAGLAIIICLFGAMDLLPQQRYDPSIFEEKIEHVNSLYGPGTVLSWCLVAVSLLYDANVSQTKFAFSGADWINWAGNWVKYAALWFLGLWALTEMMIRALQKDFGPSYAAALYMSDKAFEVATLYYCVKTFGIHRRDQAKRSKAGNKRSDELEAGHPRVQLREPTDKIYTVAPCVIMIVLWLLGRALSNGHPVYGFHDRSNPALPVSWKPLLPWYWKLIIVILCFGCSSLMGYLVKLGWWSWGFPTGVLASFAMLHSGLFGTLGAFRLTAAKISDADQLYQLVSTVLTLIVLYGLQLGESLRKSKELV